ncbi:hypothetical protein BASA81_005582 [Batrachochytrium salamandrivorans]|nr:hypothetical protein BASA81_005582 [Batrachochytrium salamandrivorans]
MKKVAAVTGSSRGIGKAVALKLASRGYKVLLLGRPSPELSQVLCEINVEGEGEIILMDLLDSQHCATVLAGRQVDVLVNCAIYQGPGENARFDQLDLGEYTKLYTGNVLSQVALIQSVLPHMLSSTCCSIFQLVSSSTRIQPTRAVDKGGFQAFGYVSTKSAISKLVPLLKLEHESSPSQIRFFNLDPGLVITDKMVREGTAPRFIKYGATKPEDTAEVIAFLATASSDHTLVKQSSGAEFVYAPTLLTMAKM